MGKFSQEFYENQIKIWKENYLNYNEINLFLKDFHKEILSQIENEKNSNEKNSNENKFKQIDEISLKKIHQKYPEIQSNKNKISLEIIFNILESSIHKIYLFYIEKEKEIFNSLNNQIKIKKKLHKFSNEAIQTELNKIITNANLIYLILNYVNSNIEAIRNLLRKIDKNFSKIFDFNISELFYIKNLTQEQSDLKYMLNFKIIIESSAIIENFYNNFKNPEFKKEKKELKEILNSINEIQTLKTNNKLIENYHQIENKGIVKNINNNVNYLAQNSFIYRNDFYNDSFVNFETKVFDNALKIYLTKNNKINIFLCFLCSFFYSFFYIIPYNSLYAFFISSKNEEKDEKNIFFSGLILAFTHFGIFLSQIIFTNKTKFKKNFIFAIFSCFLCFLIIEIINKNDKIIFYYKIILLSFARFFFGLGKSQILIRKYFLFNIPESKIKFYSLKYILISFFGYFFGNLSILFYIFINIKINHNEIYNSENEKILEKNLSKWNFISNKFGLISFLILFILFVVFFTEPKNNLMLDQNLNENNINIRLISKNEIESYSSLEKVVNDVNNNNNYDDMNLISKEIFNLKNKNFVKSKFFWKSFFIIIFSLLISKISSEFLLIFFHDFLDDKYPKIENNNKNDINNFIRFYYLIILYYSIIILFFIPIFLILKLTKNFTEKKILILINLILIINFSIFCLKKNKNIFYFVIFGIFTIFCDTSIESLINILYQNIFPSNLYIFKINIKILISLSTISGKIIGGIFYFILYFYDPDPNSKWIDKYYFLILLIFSSILLCFNIIFYNELKIRAINKLILMED